MSTSRLSFALFLGCLCAAPAVSQTYTIVDLGAVPGSTSATPVAMNALGDCVGWSTVVSRQHAFLYTDAQGMIDLGNLPGNSGAVARGLNELRQVVGESTWVEWRWSAATGMVEYAPNHWTRPTAINNRGMIVGTLSPGTFWPSPFLFTPAGGVVQFVGAVWGNAFDVNESGVIAGNWGGPSAAVFDSVTGTSQPLPALPNYPWNAPAAINELGQVAGNASPVQGFTVWFRYTPGVGIQNLGRPNLSFQATARGMNNRGEIVGDMSNNPVDQAFLYTDQLGYQNLNALVAPGSGYSLRQGVDINDAGQILCHAYHGGMGSFRAVRLDPVSMKAAAVSVGTGCAAGSSPVLAGGLPVLGATLSSSLSNATPLTSGFLILSGAPPAATELGGGCTLYVDLTAPLVALPITTDIAGNASFSVQLPGTSGLAGLPLTTQVAFLGTGGPRGIDLSNGFLQRLGF